MFEGAVDNVVRTRRLAVFQGLDYGQDLRRSKENKAFKGKMRSMN